jgi:hypothetical protein
MSIIGWQRHGLLYWLAFGPLLATYAATGVPWIVLTARDLFARRLFKGSRPDRTGCVAVNAHR